MAKNVVIESAAVFMASKEHVPNFQVGDDFHSFVARQIANEAMGIITADELEPLVGQKLLTTDPDYSVQNRHAKVTVTTKADCFYQGSVTIFYPLVDIKYANVNGIGWNDVVGFSAQSDSEALPQIIALLGYQLDENEIEALLWSPIDSTLTITAKDTSTLFVGGSKLEIAPIA